MFCSNCGKEIDDKAVVCVGCGVATNTQKNSNINNKPGNRNWILEFLSILFSFNTVTFALLGAVIDRSMVFSAALFGTTALALGIIAFVFYRTKKLLNKFNAIIAFSLGISSFLFAIVLLPYA